MILVHGDLWDYPADVHGVTTNGVVKSDGTAVMGAGVALQAATRYPSLPVMLGEQLSRHGNHCFDFYFADRTILTFPTKEHWRDPSEIAIIERSAREAVTLADHHGWERIVLSRPGVGHGRLSWTMEVMPAIQGILDDRFHVITF